jgi:hypothetical protein
MRGLGSLPPLTDEQRLQRQIDNEIWLAERRWRDEQQRAASEQARLEAAAQRQREAAIAAEQHRQRVNRDIAERGNRNRELGSIYDRLTRAEQFRNHAWASARQQAAINQRQVLIADIEKDIASLSPPPPEPNIVVVREDDGSADFGSRNFDVAKWAKKPRSWW